MSELPLISFIILIAFTVIIFLIKSKNVIELVLLNTLFSICTCLMYLILDAPDVAMTEAVISSITSVLAVISIRVLYKDSFEFTDKFKPEIFIPLMFVALIFIYAAQDLSEFGSPKFDSVYLELTPLGVGIESSVAAILANFRGFDTLLETIVIFVGGMSVTYIKLVSVSVNIEKKPDELMLNINKLIMPIILLFAFYLQIHGEISPGGGFQAGAILAISFIIYALILGDNNLQRFVLPSKLIIISVLGVLVYFLTGLVGIIFSEEFLNYSVLLGNKLFAQQLGIIMVEFGVGIAVSSIIILIYQSLSKAYAPTN